jgi:hypothetical protein
MPPRQAAYLDFGPVAKSAGSIFATARLLTLKTFARRREFIDLIGTFRSPGQHVPRPGRSQ